MNNVEQTIAPADTMYQPSNPDRYFAMGAFALDEINLARAAAGSPPPSRILDLGCGYGRVVRSFASAYPDASITACDIDDKAVQFCAETLGAEPLLGVPDPAELDFGEPFDVIWSGSLLTHVDAHLWPGYLALFQEALTTGGVAVFTFHGRYVAERLQTPGEYTYGLDPTQSGLVVAAYEDAGFGYQDHMGVEGYGLSLSAAWWVVRQVIAHPLRVVHLHERGWGGHQDVIGVMRVP